jgi:hypothetical protein
MGVCFSMGRRLYQSSFRRGGYLAAPRQRRGLQGVARLKDHPLRGRSEPQPLHACGVSTAFPRGLTPYQNDYRIREKKLAVPIEIS